jgi:hypothetical protein
MIPYTVTTSRRPLTIDPGRLHPGLSGLFAAAVVSNSFCELLLSDPQRALQQGYMGRPFNLNAEDAALIVSLNAASLKDLAAQVVRTLRA